MPLMMLLPPNDTIAVLASGGLDSAILIGKLLSGGRRVQPIHIRTGLHWQAGELAALKRFLEAVASDKLGDLVVLDLPLADLYDGHWSLTGRDVPDAETTDEAVFLPGRNALLIVKAAVWCQLRSIGELALATLGTSPFADAGESFFRDFERAMNCGSQRPLRLARP
ncbi:MAG TPA: 7-cyano-7-deazaguanine synthase, partial [Pirellulaceae bacterium]|nr:7-cyano-7-deazaguanine synthase [Pirellulaceae bacterium]